MRVLRIYHGALEPGFDQRDAALTRAGISVIATAPRQWPGGTTHREGVHLIDVKRPGDVNRHTYVSPAEITELAKDVDLVDLHAEPFSAVTHQLLEALPPGLPVVCYTAQNIDKRWPPPFHQWQRQAFERISGIYPCSRQAASVARGAGFAGIITPLPLGTDISAFFPGSQRHDASEFVLGLVGRLIPRKGVADAVEVLAALNAVRPTRLIVIGEGSETVTALHLAARLGVQDQLTISGWESPGALACAYRTMHVVLVPSKATRTWVEQFGRVVTEGRACGAVAVGYDNGSLPEVIGTSGITVAEGNVDALAASCLSLAADSSTWEKFRTEGILNTTSWDDVAADQITFYRAVLAGAPRSQANRVAAVEEFGAPAAISGGGRPFALPVLREDTAVSRSLGAALDKTRRPWQTDRATEQLLLAAVTIGSDTAPLLEQASATSSPARVIELARDHAVIPLLGARTARSPEAWPALAEALRPIYLSHVGRTMVLQAETRDLVATLEAAGIPYAIVKGPVLAGHGYGNLELRAFSDIDLVVARGDVMRAAEAIGATGISQPGIDAAADRGAGQVSGTLPRGTSLDLHWELINDPLVRRDFDFPTEAALARRREVSLEGRLVSTLDAADTLLHLASHTAVSGGHRLVWYVDIDRTVRRDGIDADLLIQRARRAELGTPLAVLLARCAHQLKTPVPAGLIRELAGSRAWLMIGRALDAATPLSSSPLRPVHGQIYFRATRETLSASLRATRSLAREVRRTPTP